MPTLHTVCLSRCSCYDPAQLKSQFDAYLPNLLRYNLRSARVFLKPNLISAGGAGLACTDPGFLLALGGWFCDRGAKVAVGDSPAFGKASSVLRSLGIDGELRRRGIAVTDFNRVVSRKLACGVEVGLAGEVFDCDLLCNVPKVKAHNQMYITLAVKNLFGIVQGMRKSMLHMRHGGSDNMFSRIILDLIELIPAHFAVADGIYAMHIQGPIHGERLDLGCIGLSADPVALDCALLHALRLDPLKSPLWQEARRRGWPSADIGKIAFPRLRPDAFFDVSFRAPADLAPIRFNPFRFIRNSLKRCGLKLIGR